MNLSLQSDLRSKRPRKGISAEVLVDGISPAPPRDIFQLDFHYSAVASFLITGDRGFMRSIPLPQFPKPSFITLCSNPRDLDQYRLAFGLTLIDDLLKQSGRMGIRLHFRNSAVAKFVAATDPQACLKFLEAIEGVDDILVKFRYRDSRSNSLVRGNVSL